MPLLFQPIRWRELELPNRIVIAPMCQYSADEGRASDWHLIHLGHLALSGAGLMFLEATAVEPDGRISPDDLGLWSDGTEQALAAVLKSVRRWSDIPIGVQLAHAGRKASTRVPWAGGGQIPAGAPSGEVDTGSPPGRRAFEKSARPDAKPLHTFADRAQPRGWRTWGPSDVPFKPDEAAPQALDAAGLERVLQAFVQATRRAERLGLDAVEIHAAHGYLLHQFLSPLSNLRDDAFGGALEGRMRFPLQVFEAVRAAWPPPKPVSVRISATDWVAGGWDLEQSVAFVQALKDRGCDVVHVSSAGLSPQQQVAVGPGYQTAFAARIKAETGLPTIAVGLITDPVQAEHVLQTGQADMVALARGVLYDPRWPWHAAAALGASVRAPNQYLRSQPHGLRELFAS